MTMKKICPPFGKKLPTDADSVEVLVSFKLIILNKSEHVILFYSYANVHP